MIYRLLKVCDYTYFFKYRNFLDHQTRRESNSLKISNIWKSIKSPIYCVYIVQKKCIWVRYV